MQAQRHPHAGMPDDVDVAAHVGPNPVSIDDIALRLGKTGVREVRRLSLELEDAARAGRIRSLGRGMWSGIDSKPPPDPATPDDVIRHGFAAGAPPATFGEIRDAVAGATGRNVLRLHETFTAMVNDGLLEHRNGKDYALTPLAMQRRVPGGMGRIHRKALGLVADLGPVCCGQISILADVPLGMAAKALSEMVAAGLVSGSTHKDGMVRYLRRDDGMQGIGPAEGRALVAMMRPVTPIEIAGLLDVSRERARQLARRLVERGLAEAKPPDGQWKCVRYVARTAPVPG